MLNAEFAWNWPSGSGEEDLSKVASVFNFIVMISPCKRAWLLFRILHPSDFFFCILGANFTLWQTLWRHHFQKLVFKTVIPFDKIIQTAATLQNKNSPRKSPITVYLTEHKFSLVYTHSAMSSRTNRIENLQEKFCMSFYTILYTIYIYDTKYGIYDNLIYGVFSL